MNQKVRTIQSYNALRGIAALMIFFHHNSYLAEAVNPFWREFYLGFLKYGARCTSFFFILSGFLLAYTWKDVPFGRYMKNKLKRLYPLTAVVFLLALGCSFIMNEAINGDVAMGSPLWFVNIVLNVLLLKAYVPIRSVYYSFHAPSWYISILMGFYVAGYFVMSGMHKNGGGGRQKLCRLTALVLTAYILQLLVCIAVDFLNIAGFEQYLSYINPWFRIFGEGMLGILLCESMPQIQKKLPWCRGSAAEAAALAVFTAFLLASRYMHLGIWVAWVWCVPTVFLLCAFYSDGGIISKGLKKAPWQFLGKISFELYLTHAFVYEGLPVIVGMFSGKLRDLLVQQAGTRVIITLVLSLIAAWCAQWGMKLITKWLFQRKQTTIA